MRLRAPARSDGEHGTGDARLIGQEVVEGPRDVQLAWRLGRSGVAEQEDLNLHRGDGRDGSRAEHDAAAQAGVELALGMVDQNLHTHEAAVAVNARVDENDRACG